MARSERGCREGRSADGLANRANLAGDLRIVPIGLVFLGHLQYDKPVDLGQTMRPHEGPGTIADPVRRDMVKCLARSATQRGIKNTMLIVAVFSHVPVVMLVAAQFLPLRASLVLDISSALLIAVIVVADGSLKPRCDAFASTDILA